MKPIHPRFYKSSQIISLSALHKAQVQPYIRTRKGKLERVGGYWAEKRREKTREHLTHLPLSLLRQMVGGEDPDFKWFGDAVKTEIARRKTVEAPKIEAKPSSRTEKVLATILSKEPTPAPPLPKPEPAKVIIETKEERHLSTTDRSKIIRNELKKLGVKASVRSAYFSGGSSIDVTLKQWYPIEKVEKIANKQERVDRDMFGEILSGGNRYVSVDFDSSLEPTPKMVEQVKQAIGSITFSEGSPVTSKYYHLTNILAENDPKFDKKTWGHILHAVIARDKEIRKEVEGY